MNIITMGHTYYQCNKCANEKIRGKKPFGDYFLCPRDENDCYGIKHMVGFGPELEHWADTMCKYCAEELHCCRTCGRAIKTDIYSSNTADPTMYDRDNGEGSFRRIVEGLRVMQ